jgi:hypothetical protein
LLEAVSSMTNNTAPSAESATRFTLTWSIGRRTFVSWSALGGSVEALLCSVD